MEHLAKKSKEEKKIVASKKVKPFKLSFMDPARVNKLGCSSTVPICIGLP